MLVRDQGFLTFEFFSPVHKAQKDDRQRYTQTDAEKDDKAQIHQKRRAYDKFKWDRPPVLVQENNHQKQGHRYYQIFGFEFHKG